MMHVVIVMRKLKDSSFGRLLTFLLVYAFVITLITQYFVTKETAPLDNTQINLHSWTKLDGAIDKTASLEDRLGELKSALIRAERELEQIKLAKMRANDCPQLPCLKLPLKLNAAPEYDNYSPLPDQRVSSNCQLIDCFDFSRCSFSSGFPVFVYDRLFGNLTLESKDTEIFQLLKRSPYYSAEPEKACLYLVIVGSVVPARHLKSKSDLETELHSLPYWKGNGKNHLLLHLKTDRRHFTSILSFTINTGFALVAQSTFLNNTIYRHGFDIVVPPSIGPLKGDVWHLAALQLPARRKYLLSFQAEHADHLTETMAILRDQLHTISREARDVLIELYPLKSEFLNSTGNSDWLLWGSHENRTKVLTQSTFTLIVGSNSASSSWDSCHVRMLEALQSGAIPVILSSKAMLPFDDVIDWRKAAIILSQARLPELNVLLRTIATEDILDMRRQGRFLWETYLSTTDAILKTVLATIRTRLSIPAHHVPASPTPSVFKDSKPPVTSSPDPDAIMSLALESPTFFRNLTSTVVDAYNVWNFPPGSFRMFPSTPFTPVLPSSAPFKNSGKGFELIGDEMGGAGAEFNKALGGNYPVEQFTIVILTYKRELVLIETIKRLVGLKYLNKVVVVWNSLEPPSSSLKWPDVGVPVHVVKVAKNSLNNRFIPYDAIETDAILSIDDDIRLKHEEILLCFRVWREARDRIVGIPVRFHAWDSKNQQWRYAAGTVCELSIVLTGAAFYHKYYGYLYTHWMPQVIRDKVDEYMNCEDLAMNFLVSHITRKPPIKVTSLWQFPCQNCSDSLWYDKKHFSERHKCLNFFVEVYGYMPLLRTQFRAVSVLFKTGVSRLKSQCFENV